jgi:hypothetical protein
MQSQRAGRTKKKSDRGETLTRLLLRRRGSYVNAAAALGASRLEAEEANHAGYVFEAPAGSWMQQ